MLQYKYTVTSLYHGYNMVEAWLPKISVIMTLYCMWKFNREFYYSVNKAITYLLTYLLTIENQLAKFQLSTHT